MCYGPAVIDAEYLNGGEPGLSQTLAPLRQSTTYTYGRDLRLMACHVIDLLDKSGKLITALESVLARVNVPVCLVVFIGRPLWTIILSNMLAGEWCYLIWFLCCHR